VGEWTLFYLFYFLKIFFFVRTAELLLCCSHRMKLSGESYATASLTASVPLYEHPFLFKRIRSHAPNCTPRPHTHFLCVCVCVCVRVSLFLSLACSLSLPLSSTHTLSLTHSLTHSLTLTHTHSLCVCLSLSHTHNTT
jgi:hypothetical protein